MNDLEKSVMLAKVAELDIEYSPMMMMGWCAAGYTKQEQLEMLVPDLYDPSNMALAWRVHLWMLDNENKVRESPYAVSPKPYTRWWDSSVPWMSPDAQRLWLDKIFALAIEAGLIEVDNELEKS